jgi:2,3-bisphosphoglycerate-independent phosphoglycerate mutase
MKSYKPVVLVVLDGLGINTEQRENPYTMAKKPTFEEFEQWYPFAALQASALAVGLPWGEPGNSEVGHLTMGAGRIVYQHLPRIVTAIQDGTFFTNPAFLKAAARVKKNNAALHLVGLFSTGSVHAYVDHLYALLEFAKREQIERVFLHLFTDGRDAPKKEAGMFLPQLQERLQKKYSGFAIASLIGRSFAMDRDERWDQIQKAFACLVDGKGKYFLDPIAYLNTSYAEGATDEFIEPAFLADDQGAPIGRIHPNDAVIFFNFREDSMRELTSIFIKNNFAMTTMTQYDADFSAEVAFPPLEIAWPFARLIAHHRKSQLHLAETEKYAHVTYFFNGGREEPFEGEERTLIASSKIIHYDESPEMKTGEITQKAIEALPKFDFLLINYANADMVGHTGNIEATIKAIETLDQSLATLRQAVQQTNGILIITADHGNAEQKREALTGELRPKHNLNPVPFFLIAHDMRHKTMRTPSEIEKIRKNPIGTLADIAPTILPLMNLPTPAEMTGINLLPKIL